ncbi:MAG: hypothetical protein NW226_12330 [Microscillaceae bacterium]|nr:hypothetical protein [Microscillaceae bacterium]
MTSITFDAVSNNGVIKIPENYQEFLNASVKITLMKKPENTWEEKKLKLIQLFKKARELRIFESIENPSAWQRSIRDEWE